MPHGVSLYVSLRRQLLILFRNGVVSGVGMVATGFPVLLAIVALVGFVVVEVVLKFGA